MVSMLRIDKIYTKGKNTEGAVKTHIAMKVSSVLFCLTICFIGNAAAGAQSIPKNITGFYQSYNFISSFSTPSERTLLFRNFTLPKDDAGKPALSNRLERVLEEMERVEKKVWKADPGIELTVPALKKWHKPVMYRIRSFAAAEESILIHVLAYPLKKEQNDSMISWYESGTGNGPPNTDTDAVSRIQSGVPYKEIHFWFFVNDRWLLNEKRIGLLK